ncbi:UTP--glucose-1-phosphate uridylyltransferase [Sulfurimonas sp.]|uniref:galactose-1-phosphate uridylyltransferase n=1 Tax=Sulfurimonas sp. TaxID=2022749 RepID=UPI0025F861DC|nr:UTP--glucose-1-phosphate uridylyltransferase [Sulfurimonas sp.]MDD5157028.1 UTP--glucose-1-phosphate uridylyltransferase [Sulfurimonas sp.]
MSEIRYNQLHDTYVIMAPQRLRRPDFATIKTQAENDRLCPFCEGNEAFTPKEIFAMRNPESMANHRDWYTRVIPNLYKAVEIEAPYQKYDGNFVHWDGFGAHEIIIDTPSHKISMSEWSLWEMVVWLKTLRSRVEDLRRDHRLVFISLFKNEGANAGSTMSHSHTQLIALPIIPKIQHEMNVRCCEYFEKNSQTLMESIILNEEEAKVRMVESYGEFSAFCPYASSYPFEVIISSKKNIGQIDTINDVHINELVTLLFSIIQKMKNIHGDVPFNLWISTPPLGVDAPSSEPYRLMIRIMPRIYRLGGFEVGTQMMINPVEPEFAAKLLRGEEDV